MPYAMPPKPRLVVPLSSGTVSVLTAVPVDCGASLTSQIVVLIERVTAAIAVTPPFVVVSTITRDAPLVKLE